MTAYLSYTLRMKTPFRGWSVMVHDKHTRKSPERRCTSEWSHPFSGSFISCLSLNVSSSSWPCQSSLQNPTWFSPTVPDRWLSTSHSRSNDLRLQTYSFHSVHLYCVFIVQKRYFSKYQTPAMRLLHTISCLIWHILDCICCTKSARTWLYCIFQISWMWWKFS